MEVRRLIRKPLQPTRPIHRTVPDNGDVFMVNFQATFANHCGGGIKDPCDLWCPIGNPHDVTKDPIPKEPPENKEKGCDLLLSNKMEIRRLIRKPLQPTRPIRRTVLDNGDVLMVNFQSRFTNRCGDGIKDPCTLWCSIPNSYEGSKGLVPEEPPINNKKDRIIYTREFLMKLSNVPASKQKPKYLPDLSITLQHPVFSLRCAADPSAIMQNTHLSDHRF